MTTTTSNDEVVTDTRRNGLWWVGGIASIAMILLAVIARDRA